MMLDFAAKAIEDPRPMLYMPLRLDGDNWVDWMPPKSHPLFDRFQLLELQYYGPEYDDQKPLLDELHEIALTDVFTASYSAIQKEDGSVMSYCTWSKGLDTLLPKTTMVMFYDDD